MSWWSDISPLLDKDQLLPLPKIRRVLEMLDERQADFRANMKELSVRDRKYFEERAAELRSFLDTQFKNMDIYPNN